MVLPILVSVAGKEVGQEEAVILKKMRPLGISLFARNIADKIQLKNLVAQIKDILGEKTLIGIDQEGGRVRRLAEPCWRGYASQSVLGKLPVEISKMHAALIAQDLNELGINLNYAPVLDNLYECTHSVLKSRCFGNEVAKHGKTMIETYIKNGICPCIKHMPGHGRAESDPHLGLPVIEGCDSELAKDMEPFAANADAPAGMTAHIVVPQIDNLPVTMSKVAIDTLIRGRIGFDGLLISDAIDMQALKGSIKERAEKSLTAGCDVVCYCGGDIKELAELADVEFRTSTKTESRLERIYKIVADSQKDLFDYERYAQAVNKIDEYKEEYDATEVLNLMKQNK